MLMSHNQTGHCNVYRLVNLSAVVAGALCQEGGLEHAAQGTGAAAKLSWDSCPDKQSYMFNDNSKPVTQLVYGLKCLHFKSTVNI